MLGALTGALRSWPKRNPGDPGDQCMEPLRDFVSQSACVSGRAV